MARTTLDRTRSYATVVGGSGPRYYQDHKGFDHTGIEIVDDPPAASDTEAVAEPDEPTGPEIEDQPITQVSMKQLRDRYSIVTGGKKAKVGLNKTQIRELIREAR